MRRSEQVVPRLIGIRPSDLHERRRALIKSTAGWPDIGDDLGDRRTTVRPDDRSFPKRWGWRLVRLNGRGSDEAHRGKENDSDTNLAHRRAPFELRNLWNGLSEGPIACHGRCAREDEEARKAQSALGRPQARRRRMTQRGQG